MVNGQLSGKCQGEPKKRKKKSKINNIPFKVKLAFEMPKRIFIVKLK
jgi:hypothetical protein